MKKANLASIIVIAILILIVYLPVLKAELITEIEQYQTASIGTVVALPTVVGAAASETGDALLSVSKGIMKIKFDRWRHFE